jgi:hypothetical protein
MSDWQTAPSKTRPKGPKPESNNRNNQKSSSKKISAQVNSSQERSSNNKKDNNKSNSNSFAKMMSGNAPPKGGFNTSPAKKEKEGYVPTTQKEVSIEHAYVAKDMTRSYELTRMPPNGFESVLKKTFPSLDVCFVNSVDIKGKTLLSLFLHFSEDHKSSYNDFDNSASLNISVQGIGIRLTAVGSEKTDGDGVLIPKVSKTIHASGMPFSLARNANAIRSLLSEYITFDESDSIKMIYEDGMYRGNVVVPVNEYIKMPPSTVNFPFYTMNQYGNY